MALFQFDFRDTPEERKRKEQERQAAALQPLLGLETFQQQGPVRPGEALPQITAQQQGMGLPGLSLPQAQTMQGLLQAGQTEPAIQGLLGAAFPTPQKPTTAMQNLAAMGLTPGTKQFNEAMRQYMLKPQVQIGATKPLGAGASRWRNPQGQAADPRMTINQAADLGFRPQSTEQQKAQISAQQAGPMFGAMIKHGFGEGKQKAIFPEAGEGMAQRGIGGAQAWLQGVTASNERVALYNQGRNAMVTGLARLVGQVGTLTDRDVDIVAGLLPTPGLTPKSLAKKQFKQIGDLLKSRGVSNPQLKEMGFPDWALVNSGGQAGGSPWKKYKGAK